MGDDKELVYGQLTELTSGGGALGSPNPELATHFDTVTRIRIAREYLALQDDVQAAGRAVVYSAGPPGAGKSSALSTLDLDGYRTIDPDVAKDLILEDAERHGLLSFRHDYILADGKSVSPRELVSHIHETSNLVCDIVRDISLTAGENLVIDGTLSWDELGAQYVEELFKYNYEGLTVVDVELPLAESLSRAKDRWWKGRLNDPPLGGRFMPEFAIKNCYNPGNDQESRCALNASNLAIRAADELGSGTLMRFEVDIATGSTYKKLETHYRSQ